MKQSFIIFSILFIITVGCGDRTMDPGLPAKPIVFADGVINDEIDGVPVVIYGNSSINFFSAFSRMTPEGDELRLKRSQLAFPQVFQDAEGGVWDVFGKSFDNNVHNLVSVDNLVGYWFSFPAFHQNITMYDGSEITNPVFDHKSSEGWLIDRDFVFAGSIKDGIQSIDNPKFIGASSKAFIDDAFYKSLDPESLVTAVRVGDEVHIYPQQMLEYHEVVNDQFGDHYVVVSFCPLTGTSRAWDRQIMGEVREFGVSGLLYNNNLILYDRNSGSNWSQIFNRSVNGVLVGADARTLDVWELRMADMLSINGNIKLLSTDTGIQYDYQYSVYGDYKDSDRISFPLTFSDQRIFSKERVMRVTVGNQTKVYRFADFDGL